MKPQEKEDLKMTFMECDTCRPKPGSPILCRGCLHNRDVIEGIIKKIKRAKAEERERIIQEIVEYAEPYDNSKWLNSIDAKKLINFLSTPQEGDNKNV